MAALHIEVLFFIVFLYSRIHGIISHTHHGDGAVLKDLKKSWKNTPATWNLSSDPCGSWEGVTCTNSRVTDLYLTRTSLEGELGGVIGGLTELTSLYLPGNNLTGPLPPQLGNLSKLTEIDLDDCNFTGSIPDELGNLTQLSLLNLGINNLTGEIPPSLGKLSNLVSLELSQNQLSGKLPVSTEKTPGLDLLLKAEYFYFDDNKLSGSIPSKLFSPNKPLKYLYLSRNQFKGKIPDSLGLVQTLQELRLNQNALSGEIPSTFSNLTNLKILDLSQNRLSGVLPDLSKMASLRRLSFNNNSFDAAEAPTWFSTLPSLISLHMEYGSLQGPVPTKLFSLPRIQEVKLRNNSFNVTLTINGANIISELELVDLKNNQISSLTFDSSSATLMLKGNPICAKALPNTDYCQQ